MSGAIVPQWLTSLDTMKSLLQFLSEPGISALTKDIYNVDFHPGVHGVIGWWSHRITVLRGFCQADVPASTIVKEGDDKDTDIGQDSRVSPFTDSDRVDMAGGTYIEMSSDSRCIPSARPTDPKSQDSAAPCWTMHTIQAKTFSYQKVIYSYTRYVGEFPEVAKVGDMAVRTPQQWYTYFQEAWHLAVFGTNHPSRSQHQTTDQGCLNLLLLANLLNFPRFSVVAESPNTGITNSRRWTRFWLDISVQLENGTQQWINPPLS
ncbi:hypothetical protein B0H13DRAFT_1869929 [Mycena leptocephala]|nr:hypothetical protein B0H13DRAFT_1869929 [Mycena leptocephala]